MNEKFDYEIVEDFTASIKDIVSKKRSSVYGDPIANHDRICELWNFWMRGRYGEEATQITRNDVVTMMILVKIARLVQSPDHLDSLVDIAGYSAIQFGSSLSEMDTESHSKVLLEVIDEILEEQDSEASTRTNGSV